MMRLLRQRRVLGRVELSLCCKDDSGNGLTLVRWVLS